MTTRTRFVAYFVIALGVLITVWVLIHGLTGRVQHAEQSAKTNHSAAVQAKQAVDALAQQVKELGGEPVVKPHEVSGPVGPTGDTGPVGPSGPSPSRAQVEAAVQQYCATGVCRGAGPTQGQVASAVAAYCAGGRCRGPVGTRGTPGIQGLQGVPGQNATDAQVQAAVATYCGNHANCQGPKGDSVTGPPGADGKNAFPFTFTFTVPARLLGGTAQTYSCTVATPSTTAVCATTQ